MNNLTKTSLSATIALFAIAILTACGNSDDRSIMMTEESGEAAPQIATETEAPTAAADNLKGNLQPEEEDEPIALDTSGEDYNPIEENPFLAVQNRPLSTFAIDVDSASYSNARRFINDGALPPPDAVRIEEFINYFTYNYPQPEGDRPFSITTEVSEAPWNRAHKLVRVGLQGKNVETEELPPSNLVFLLDVSGSMNDSDKLPLLKEGFRLLAEELTENDRVAIVVYAGASGVVLPSTPGNEKDKILTALNRLQAGGGTAGSEGIQRAYELARENFIEGGNNRVILATDGDFNIGVYSQSGLVNLIEQQRESNIFLTVLGFGTGNLQDGKMEQLANKGNGNYAYIDSILEAKKVLVTELKGTLLTIAKDVKVQVEFNPAEIAAYRLIGYENRLLRDRDFNDDTKDAGELGSGHSVTALYEVIPVGVETEVNLPDVDPLVYQQTQVDPEAYNNDELMQVKLRYKQPEGTESQLITQTVIDEGVRLEAASEDFRFTAAVAAFGMLLRNSPYGGNLDFEEAIALAKDAKGEDAEGYRAEFVRLAEMASLLARSR